jgi:hypothetical protein
VVIRETRQLAKSVVKHRDADLGQGVEMPQQVLQFVC